MCVNSVQRSSITVKTDHSHANAREDLATNVDNRIQYDGFLILPTFSTHMGSSAIREQADDDRKIVVISCVAIDWQSAKGTEDYGTLNIVCRSRKRN